MQPHIRSGTCERETLIEVPSGFQEGKHVLISFEKSKMAKKNLCITYFLWLCFGWLGVHHFYLGRDRHAFIYWSTFGGFFFLGWFRDLWRIPDYVDDANEEPEYMESLTRKFKLRKEPNFNIVRFTGEMLVGYTYGLLVRMAIPEECPIVVSGALVAFGVAVGVHLVGNVGREKGGFLKPLISCELCMFILTRLTGEEGSYMYCALAGACTFNYIREHRREPKGRRTTCTRITRLALSASVIFLLWGSFLYFNAHITTEDGEKVRFRDAVNNFFTSPAWLEFRDTFWQLYQEAQKQGWRNIYDEFVKALDPTGEANALKVLDLPSDATEEQIKRQYKKLAIKYHPDRYKGDPKEAEAKFIEIQQAYENLSKIKSKRNSRNRTSRNEKERTEF